jgi:DNA-binding response OmpR family regulator
VFVLHRLTARLPDGRNKQPAGWGLGEFLRELSKLQRVGGGAEWGFTVNETRIQVLLVEDEFLLRELLVEPLEEAGFSVLAAKSGEDAVIVLEREGAGIRAVLTDVNLGGEVNGWHVGHYARKVDPLMPVIYTTGQSVEEWAAHGVPNSVHINKPFVHVQVITALSQLLNTTSSSV